MIKFVKKSLLMPCLLFTASLSACQNCSGPKDRADKTDSVPERAEEMKERQDESLDTSTLPQPGTEHTSGMTGGVVKDQPDDNSEDQQKEAP